MTVASPAAAAAVSSALKRAGWQPTRDLGRRVFSPGFLVAPAGDHVRVSHHSWSADREDDLRLLASYAEDLMGRYDVRRIMGNDPHLEVRSDRWGR